MHPTPGRVVLYAMTEHDAHRAIAQAAARSHAWIPDGVHTSGGSAVRAGLNLPYHGETYPALVVRAHSDGTANLRVFLDGEIDVWVTAVSEGTGPGHWSWPARV